MLARRPPFVIIVILALCCAALAQRPDPLPIDTGATGLKQVLRQLKTTARLLHTTAHPDDEDGGMLTFEARGQGVDTMLLTLTRGEGGQNKTGSNLFDELGVLRTLELLESDRYYGVQQRFTRVADFGFSKTAEETFQKWRGHDIALGDMVRVIRTFRPDVIVSRFQGADRDGHGNHQAAGILSREAFRAAADPNRFPEQLKEGLQPWQAKKLYMDNIRQGEDYTVRFETTVVDPVLGKSYAALGWEGLKHQLSQGSGSWTMPSGPRYATYKLVDSVLPPTTDKDGHEKSFFDGIDTTLPGLASRVPAGAIPNLKATLTEIDKYVDQATADAEKSPYDAAEPLFKGLELTRKLIADVNESKIVGKKNTYVLEILHTKLSQFERAVALALDVKALADPRIITNGLGPSGSELIAAGETLELSASVTTPRTFGVKVVRVAPDVPVDWKWTPVHGPLPGVSRFMIEIPENAALSRPTFQRQNPEADTTYASAGDTSSPFPPFPIKLRVDYTWRGHHGTHSVVATSLQDQISTERSQKEVALAIGPPISLLVTPSASVVKAGQTTVVNVIVGVSSLRHQTTSAAIRLQAPDGWQVTPRVQTLEILDPEKAIFRVEATPASEHHFQLRAVAESGGKTYSEGFSIVTREDLGVFYYYQPAIQKISAVNVQLPERLKIGYLMGAGDDIPTALTQLGLDVHLITPEELATADLSQFGTIVLGIRAYDTRDDLKKNNARLLDYVKNGGTLIVQYNASVQDFNDGRFTPYPAQLSRERVSVEEAPVRVLNAADPIFHFPNPIAPTDFNGWVQERGLYYMSVWDKQYEPLLSMSDPGEKPLSGGLLRARYGKGTYIYTGLAFFRQIPAGVPGAVRLFVNLLAAGHDQTVYNASNQSAR